MQRLKAWIAVVYLVTALALFAVWYDATHGQGWLAWISRPYAETIDEPLFHSVVRKLLRTPAPAAQDLVVVSFDWRATKIYGPLPWPRDVYAALIERLRDLGVRTVLMDPLFAEAELKLLSPAAFSSLFPALSLEEIHIVNPANYVGELRSKLAMAERRLIGERAGGPLDPEHEVQLRAFRTQREELLVLARRIAEGDGAIAFERSVTERPDVIFPTDYSNIPKFQRSSDEALGLLAKQALPPFAGEEALPSFKHLLTLYTRLLRGGALVGINEIDRTEEHFLRGGRRFLSHVRVLVRHGDQVYPSSVVRALAQQRGASLAVERSSSGELVLRMGEKRFVLEADGSFPLGYYNDPAFPATVSAIEVLRDRVPRDKLAGKLALVDVRTPETEAHLKVPTPVFGASWPSELKATLASNLILGHRGPTVIRPVWLGWLEGSCIWLIAGAFIYLTLGLRVSLLRSLGVALLLLLATILLDVLVFMPRRWFNPGILVFEVLLMMFAAVWAHYRLQRSEREHIRRAFGFYLPGPVLDHVLRDEAALRLGGERRNLSILFSDIRGFTHISEQANPEALGEALNVHLTQLTEAVFEHGGTLDKYMGDCVMAFFGAPVHHSDHAARAVAAALAMQERLAAIMPVWRAKCGADVAIGVGVASGDVIVGNMGSSKIFDYTVVGDTVNLASRLEGLTKVYGAGVLVSEETRRQAGEQFSFLEVDRVRVKGKREPVRIYEVSSSLSSSRTAGTRAPYDELVQAGLAAFRLRDFAAARVQFTAAAGVRPDARLPALYLERIAKLEGSPLPEDWDGVTEFDHK